MMKECATYDNVPAKQSRWEISLRNARYVFLDPATTLLTFRGRLNIDNVSRR